MSVRKIQLTAQILTAFSILSVTFGCSRQNTTVFHCVEQQDEQDAWATIAQQGDNTSSVPMISWKSLEFGKKWDPKKRCFHVSGKLTNTVAQNGGKLVNLYLAYGEVDTGQTVICVLNAEQQDCDRQNMLFTLNKENAKNPSFVLKRIENFTYSKGTNSTVYEKGGISTLSLEALVNRSLQTRVVY